MKSTSFLIKPASSLCNMNCLYCFYKDVSNYRKDYSKGIMKKSTVDILIKKALDDSKVITFAFQGGEPTLAGIEYFEYFISQVEKNKIDQVVHYAIQTNGYLLNDKWIQLFKKYDFLVGVSLDGYEKIHDKLRIKNQEKTFEVILSHINKLKENKINYNILTVITRDLAKYPKEVYHFYKEQDFQYIQFIPCLPQLDHSTDDYYLSPREFYHFYIEIFHLWLNDIKRGKHIFISLFEDLLMIFQGKYPRTCGMLGNCTIQLVIEGDGTVYPCDFYASDHFTLGSIHELSLDELRNNQVANHFIKQEKRYSQLCGNCKFKNVCRGQCKRMNVVYFDEEYCGYQQFLEKTYKLFYELGKRKQGL